MRILRIDGCSAQCFLTKWTGLYNKDDDFCMNKLQLYLKDSAGKKTCLIAFVIFLLSLIDMKFRHGEISGRTLSRGSLLYLMIFYLAHYEYLYFKYSKGLHGTYREKIKEIESKLRLAKWIGFTVGVLEINIHLFLPS